MLWPAWLLMILPAGVSFFCSAAETALFSLGRWQLQHLCQESPRHGERITRLLSQPQELLATMVLGNTTAFATLLATVTWMALNGHWPFQPAIAGLLIFLIFFCELVPKTLAVRRPAVWSARVAAPLEFAHRLTLPLRRVSQRFDALLLKPFLARSADSQRHLNDPEYQELLEWAQQQGTLEQSEKEIILEVMSLDRRTARDVMRPRSQMACIPDDLSVEEMLQAARRFRHRRLPMYDENEDTIVGVLNTRALLLDPATDLADVIEFPSFVPESMNLLQLLRSLQRQQRGMAIVLDEFGGTAGIVTLEDILKEVVGAARDDAAEDRVWLEPLGPDRWRLHGAMRIDDFRRSYPALGEVEEVETMGGLLVQLLEVVPSEGQSAVFRGLRLTAGACDARRVRELIVERVK
ncbi:MAG: hemolysin family protein [Verrucomicrobia bacterium]|jgi:CBS domain containing-hemolysin-like protein|nr:hemolysin family protein [Verrucomicrobiota bacterium]